MLCSKPVAQGEGDGGGNRAETRPSRRGPGSGINLKYILKCNTFLKYVIVLNYVLFLTMYCCIVVLMYLCIYVLLYCCKCVSLLLFLNMYMFIKHVLFLSITIFSIMLFGQMYLLSILLIIIRRGPGPSATTTASRRAWRPTRVLLSCVLSKPDVMVILYP